MNIIGCVISFGEGTRSMLCLDRQIKPNSDILVVLTYEGVSFVYTSILFEYKMFVNGKRYES